MTRTWRPWSLGYVNILHSGWHLQLSGDPHSHVRMGQTGLAPNQWKVKIMQPHRKNSWTRSLEAPYNASLFLLGYTSLRFPSQIQRKLNVSPQILGSLLRNEAKLVHMLIALMPKEVRLNRQQMIFPNRKYFHVGEGTVIPVSLKMPDLHQESLSWMVLYIWKKQKVTIEEARL